MISLLNKNNKLNENKNSLMVTYPRTVNILLGNYPYPDIVHNFILDIKNNLDPKMKNYTNVKGGMTDWCHFLDKDNFKNFFTYLINTHQTTYPNMFEHFLEKNSIINSWGNEIKLGDSLDYHTHTCWHGILYLTKGCDLILPELNLKITPEAGDYYIFPPEILHGFDKSQAQENRYSLIFNISDNKNRFEYDKKRNQMIKK
jgi:mRNA-degrading endonuclease HigB of HigAB toxin-antitoxin module|tara:strand:+ start:633 stop:1235 length:603 start_codon:yes stop_codon:yes gene_type:complete